MIEISTNTNVYVYSPANFTTGGAELLHQLVHLLNEGGRIAYIYYFDMPGAPVPEAYRSYNLRTTDKVEDAAENVVILYEAIFDRYQTVKHAQILFWWLSVDHFYMCSKDYLSVRDYLAWDVRTGLKILKTRLKGLLKGRNLFKTSVSISDLKEVSALNCYQSEYAQHFLLDKGFSEILPLKDFINLDFYSNETVGTRKDQVLYNPKKGFAFTKRLMDKAPHLKWVALENMSRAEMLIMFRSSKLYIDFGYHPGKDRIPREAAMNGCCVMTNKSGAARYFEDVSIDSAYKLDEKEVSLPEIISLMEDILANYEEHYKNFEFYRDAIRNEKNEFGQQVKQLFRLN